MHPPTTALPLARFRAVASEAFGRLHIETESPGDFSALFRVAQVGEISLFHMKTPPHTVERQREDINPTDRPHCKLSLQLDGSTILRQDGRDCVLRPGQLALYVTQRPYELIYPDPQHSLIVLFPEEFVQLSPGTIGRITAVPLFSTQGLGKVAIPLFEQLALNFEVLTGPHASTLLRSSLDMLVTAFSAELESHAGEDEDRSVIERAYSYINANLHDPDLGPQHVADAVFVSVRHLHGRFSETDTTVSAYIRSRRLERIRRELSNPLHSGESIQAIGSRYGIIDASHLSRAFRSEYDESPRAYRTRTLNQQSD